MRKHALLWVTGLLMTAVTGCGSESETGTPADPENPFGSTGADIQNGAGSSFPLESEADGSGTENRFEETVADTWEPDSEDAGLAESDAEDAVGDLACIDLIACASGCGDAMTCLVGCKPKGTAAAQEAYALVLECIEASCTAADEVCLQTTCNADVLNCIGQQNESDETGDAETGS